MNPLLFADIAQDRQAELLAEAASDRLVLYARAREARAFGPVALHAVATLLLVAAAGVLLIGAKPASSIASELSLDDVRRALQEAGYVVEPPIHWGEQAMLVDAYAENGRMLRVFVYRDPQAAEMAHRQASAQPVGSNADSDDAGPQLLSGFGSSLWRRNVALVQSSPANLRAAHAHRAGLL
jgi:hypothetical protein